LEYFNSSLKPLLKQFFAKLETMEKSYFAFIQKDAEELKKEFQKVKTMVDIVEYVRKYIIVPSDLFLNAYAVARLAEAMAWKLPEGVFMEDVKRIGLNGSAGYALDHPAVIFTAGVKQINLPKSGGANKDAIMKIIEDGFQNIMEKGEKVVSVTLSAINQ